jgi:hypothetical protein
MMRRTGFKIALEKWREGSGRPNPLFVRTRPEPSPPAKPLTRPVVLARISDTPIIVPKGVMARKGKRAPTVEERRWLDAIVDHGCVACWLDGHESRPTAVHHILRGGHRIGHLFTLPLCEPGHHQGGQPLGLISRHPDKTIFEAHYGTETYLLNYLQRKLGFTIT